MLRGVDFVLWFLLRHIPIGRSRFLRICMACNGLFRVDRLVIQRERNHERREMHENDGRKKRIQYGNLLGAFGRQDLMTVT